MQYHHVGYRVKGFYNIIRYAMKADTNKEVVAAHRLGVLEFWNQHGLQAAIDHSGKSRRTLYAWKQAYREQGLTGLRSQSKAPPGQAVAPLVACGGDPDSPVAPGFSKPGQGASPCLAQALVSDATSALSE